MTFKAKGNVNLRHVTNNCGTKFSPLPVVYCSLLLKKISIFTSFLSIKVVLSRFYTPIFYFENSELETDVCRLQ